MEAILAKSPNWVVGGVASNFFRDLDGDAIDPGAIQRAIPAFMAHRGPDGISGGPLRLHHGFWERFLKQSINTLNLPYDEQMAMVAAIALPLGRVTNITVEDDGTTRWRGELSQANPISKIIWSMLKEGLVHLGVSVGGKINAVRPGRDALGRRCNVITDVRLDELSITDNPANRLLESETPDNGAYIMALSKSLTTVSSRGVTPKQDVEQFLKKSLGNPGSEFGSGSWGDTTVPGMTQSLQPKSKKQHGSNKVKLDESASETAGGKLIAGKQPKAHRPTSSGGMPPTDVWGITVEQLTRELAKCAHMGKGMWQDPEMSKGMSKFLTDSAYGLAGLTDTPGPELINFVKFLQYLNRFAQEIPHMDDYQATGTVEAIGPDLTKALGEFVEKLPSDLKGKPLRPPGSPGISSLDIQFPAQYVMY